MRLDIIIVISLLAVTIVSSCTPASRYTTDTRTSPRSRYYRTSNLIDRFPPSGEDFRVGVTYKWLTSFYGEDFHGKTTSNGEVFDMNGMTCAHRELPFDTILRVTNPVNNRSVTVRVNDRGPFVKGRKLDLSKGAARQIDMIERGVKELLVEIIHLPN